MNEKQNETKVQALLRTKLERAALKEAGVKVQVSTRINVSAVAVLDIIAAGTGETRTGLAAELLEAAISDAADQFGFPARNTAEFLHVIQPNLDKLLNVADQEHFENEQVAG